MRATITSVAFLLLAAAAPGAHAQAWDPQALDPDPATATAPIAPVLKGLGDHHHAVTTSSTASQAFFDQGLRLGFGFNHSEAVRAFKEAARLDPRNAMAYWGWAWALGPNLNLEMQPEAVAQAYKASRQALALAGSVTPAERAYIEAIAARYGDDPKADRAALDRRYADAMGRVAAAYPDDLDAATLHAESLMDLSPWYYWEPDGSPRRDTPVILAELERVLAREPGHAGAAHFYIHAVEAFHPDRAEAAADRLVGLMPSAGHMVHMPSHIYMRVGRFADAARVNVLADQADDDYVAQCRAQGIYPFFYHRHNEHFLAWAAMFQGRSAAALEAGRRIGHGIEPPMVAGPIAETVQHLMAQPLYVLVRFGRWQDVLREPRPPAQYAAGTAMWHYARGMALRHTGNLKGADAELAALRRIAADPALKDRGIGFAPLPVVLDIGTEVLASELDAAYGRKDASLQRLERAVRLQDSLRYNEPPDWYFPVRHYLGAALLDAGRPAEAETVYWQDLARTPGNGYALFGLAKALRAQGRTAEADAMDARFRTAWRDADVTLTSSRF